MKKTYLLIFLSAILSISSVSALDIDDLLTSVNPKPSDGRVNAPGPIHPVVNDYSAYKAEGKKTTVNGKEVEFTGRNLNKASSKENETVSNSGSLTRSVSSSSSKDSSQIENLESTTGEMIIKLEDDRSRKSKEYQKTVEDSREVLTDAYLTTEKININNIGNEQDPSIQNAFKCADFDNCNNGSYEKHEIKECESDEMLSWSGQGWSCVGVFDDPGKPKCSSDQYSKNTGGGEACVDYIYQWAFEAWGACQSTGTQDSIYSCYKKEKSGDSGTKVGDSYCKFLGDKPTSSQSCNLYSWYTSSWGHCERSCPQGTSTKSRTVYCKESTGSKVSDGYCSGSKPASSESCGWAHCSDQDPGGPNG